MKLCLKCASLFQGASWRCPQCQYDVPIHDGFLAFAPELLSGSNEMFAVENVAPLAALEEGHFWFEARNQLIVWAFRTFFPSAKTFLEVGCGSGFVLKELHQSLPHMQLFGGEMLTESLTFAASRVPSATYYQLDARCIPFVDEFDVVGAFDVIEHIEHDNLALKQLVRCVKLGGEVILTVPQHQFLWSSYDENGHHYRRYNRKDLFKKMQEAGLQVRYASSFVALLLPVMLLSRIRKKHENIQDNQLSEFKIGPFLNGVLSFIMQLEHLMIRSGIRLPFGGSLLVVGERMA